MYRGRRTKSGMDFTEIYKQSSSLVAPSPGGHFILIGVQDRIIVRRTDTLQITRTWKVDTSPSPTQAALTTFKAKPSTSTTPAASDTWISHVGWSCDSEYIFSACAKRGVVHIFKLQDEEWNGRIDSGAEGHLGCCVCYLNDHGSYRPSQSRMGS